MATFFARCLCLSIYVGLSIAQQPIQIDSHVSRRPIPRSSGHFNIFPADVGESTPVSQQNKSGEDLAPKAHSPKHTFWSRSSSWFLTLGTACFITGSLVLAWLKYCKKYRDHSHDYQSLSDIEMSTMPHLPFTTSEPFIWKLPTRFSLQTWKWPALDYSWNYEVVRCWRFYNNILQLQLQLQHKQKSKRNTSTDHCSEWQSKNSAPQRKSREREREREQEQRQRPQNIENRTRITEQFQLRRYAYTKVQYSFNFGRIIIQ